MRLARDLTCGSGVDSAQLLVRESRGDESAVSQIRGFDIYIATIPPRHTAFQGIPLPLRGFPHGQFHFV